MRTTFLFAAVLSAPLPANAQNIVQNGGFESPVITQPWVQRGPGTTFGSWTVDNTGQGVAQVGTFGNPMPIEGGQCVELNFFNACGISQTVPTVAGLHYRLTFLMAGQMNAGPNLKRMRISWNGAQVGIATWDRAATGGTWQAHVHLVQAASGSSVLHFFGMEEVDGGPYLDDVRLIPLCGAADLGSTGGVRQPDGLLDNNDFVAFIDYFFAGDPLADLGSTGGVAGGDGAHDNNDFVVFVDAFFDGCG